MCKYCLPRFAFIDVLELGHVCLDQMPAFPCMLTFLLENIDITRPHMDMSSWFLEKTKICMERFCV